MVPFLHGLVFIQKTFVTCFVASFQGSHLGHIEKQEMKMKWKLETETGNGNWTNNATIMGAVTYSLTLE